MKERLEVGQIVNTFGIKGEVKVVPFTDDITRFDDLKEIYVKSKKTEKLYKIEGVRYHKNMVLLKLEGIQNPEQAELLKNTFLEIDRKDAIPLEEGTYFIVDLLGLEVYTEEGRLLGKVEDIYNTGSNDIYVVKDELGKQVLLPGIEEVIKEVDLENSKIVVHLIPGLI
ncbi:MAG: 16S rRNA processing protein RimM [Clostridia bacterium]|jgi:16S rRNA processing protein RimM|nr:16S rRNA processing protein RimM [Clostridia bacterium]